MHSRAASIETVIFQRTSLYSANRSSFHFLNSCACLQKLMRADFKNTGLPELANLTNDTPNEQPALSSWSIRLFSSYCVQQLPHKARVKESEMRT